MREVDAATRQRIRYGMIAVQFGFFGVALSWVLWPALLWLTVPPLVLAMAWLLWIPVRLLFPRY